MIWQSTFLMTIIDLAFIAAGVYVAIVVYRNRDAHSTSRTTAGLVFIAAGLLIVGGFYAADLVTMWVLPPLIGTKTAMSVMRDLHLNFSWIIITLGFGAILVGFARADAAVPDLIRRLKTTERKLDMQVDEYGIASRALSESEERYRLLIEASPYSMLVVIDGRIVFANAAAVALHGAATPADLVGMNSIDLYDPDERADVLRRRGELLAGQPIGPTLRRGVRLDGSPFIGEARALAFTWDGAPANLVMVQDVTEREKIRQELAESEERHRSLVDRLPEAVIVHRKGKIVFANPAAVELHGADSAEDLVGTSFDDLIHPDDWAIIATRRQALSDGQSLAPYARRGLRLDGSEFIAESSGLRVAWDGEPASLVVIRDVTERETARRALIESEALYRELIEGSMLGIQITRLDGTRLFVNKSCADMFGFDTPEELLAVTETGALVAPHERARMAATREARIRGEAIPEIYEFDALRKDGTVMPVQVFARFLTWEGERALHRTYIDITENRKAQEALRQAQKMDAIGQLTAGVAHDFNNLLTVVLGNLEFVEEALDADSRERTLARAAINAAIRGGILTHRLLAYARQQPLAPEVIDIRSVLAGMIDLLRRALGETIEIETVIDGGLWMCEADPGAFEDTVLNLALNARDAMPDGGRLTIEAGNARLDDEYASVQVDVEPGQYVMLSVTDTGAGIPPDILEKVFDPFFTTKQAGQGTGLGLSMVYGFVKQSKGHVAIYSEEGEGTTFKIYLPRTGSDATTAPTSTDAGAEPRSRGETIMVVEDDPDLRTLAVTMLRNLGYSVLEAGSGSAALDQLDATRGVDLLLTDVVLPGGMGGRVLAEEATKRFGLIRVLYMSGYTENAIVHHGRLDRGVTLLQKPFRMADLERKVRQVLDRPDP